VISLAYALGKAVLHRGEVRIEWTICRIRERTGPPKMLQMLGTRAYCLVDRRDCCIRCGEQGHKAAKCSKEPSCFICSAAGKKETRHQAGSRFCSATTSGIGTDMQLTQLNLNHCRAALDLLKQTVRELGSEVAILSEPYIAESTNDWVTDRTSKAALWLCEVGAPLLRDMRAAEGFIRANVGGT